MSDALREAFAAGCAARLASDTGPLTGPYPKDSPEAQEFFRGWVITNARKAADGAS